MSDEVTTRALARFPHLGDAERARLAPVARASDFAIDVLARDPALLAGLLADDGDTPPAPPVLPPDAPDTWAALLRRHRQAASTRLVWRDVHGLDDVAATLQGSTDLADACLQAALAALEAQFAQRHGIVRDAQGAPVRLVVFGLGKLGGGELNFSSDVDLVYAYEHPGASDGARPLDAEAYFVRLGQQLARLLDEVTAEGFCHRVDLRLRPFGSAGRIAWSFAALEHYFQHEGRDWERYAWLKARPVAGDLEAGERFLATLRPFVYRRYLDFGALDGLRAMKASIDAEVARRELADDIKRGPGGIREVEFLVQALQLIRGGREPALRERGLRPALAALVAAGHVDPATAARLSQAYLQLRRVENRLQMLGDAQTHVLPLAPEPRARLAAGLGFADWPGFMAWFDGVRAEVAAEFAALLAPRDAQALVPGSDAWQRLRDGDGTPTGLPDGMAEAVQGFVQRASVRGASDAARARLDRVMPALLDAAARSGNARATLERLLDVVSNVLRRSAYLALLDEQPSALQRLVTVCARSGWLAGRIAAHPHLLDELLDARVAGALPEAGALADACAEAVRGIDDTEAALRHLAEVRQALAFRIGLAVLDRREPPHACAARLAALADAVVVQVLALARAELVRTHGELPGARFAVLGYGSLGGQELGFGSDLDLVFLFDADLACESTGARPLDAQRWLARLAQKVLTLLGAETGAGQLYEVDVRLRPDGAKGLLVSSLASFAAYQRERAWTWEHQALVRTRCVAGDAGLCADFEAVRNEVLQQGRERPVVLADVTAMRARMRAELDRSDAALFDLKQGEGGLVDLEFAVQALVLGHAARVPTLAGPRGTRALVAAAADAGLVPVDIARAALAAHARLLDAGLECTLDGRARRVPQGEALNESRAAVRAFHAAVGLATPN